MTATRLSGSARLSGPARKWFLLTHILATALWFGVDIALGILVLTAVFTEDPALAGTALQVLPRFAIWPMFGASLVSLGTGIVLGLGSRYGLFRYWWVTIKLAINLLMSTLILFALRPGLDEAAGIGQRLVAGDPGAQVPSGLLFPIFVAPSLLLTAYLLAVFKPRARTPSRRRAPAETVRHADTISGAGVRRAP